MKRPKADLMKYVHAYIALWLKEKNWPDNSENRETLERIHGDWTFYVANGVFETEAFYQRFLEENGVERLADFIRLMDALQKPKKCIFQTDGDERNLAFPPAFQAAFFQWAKTEIEGSGKIRADIICDVLVAMKDAGMNRFHQSARPGDWHIMDIDDWMQFAEDGLREENAQKRMEAFERAQALALVKTWLNIDRDYDWKYSREEEEEKKILPPAITWHHVFRGFPAKSFMRCLEITGAEHLSRFLALGYVVSPEKFHYSLRHGDEDDVFVTPQFEQALETFLDESSRTDLKEQAEFVGRALLLLRKVGIRRFKSGFDVELWANVLCNNGKSKRKGDNEKGKEEENLDKRESTYLRGGLGELWRDLCEGAKSMWKASWDARLRRETGHYNETGPLPMGKPAIRWPWTVAGIWSFACLLLGQWLGMRGVDTTGKIFVMILATLVAMLLPSWLGQLMELSRFCSFVRWKKYVWRKRAAEAQRKSRELLDARETWHQAIFQVPPDADEIATMKYAAQHAEDLTLIKDWVEPWLEYCGDDHMAFSFRQALSRGHMTLLRKALRRGPPVILPRMAPNPKS